MIFIELIKDIDSISPHTVILGRIYVHDGSPRLPHNPGLLAYYPDEWIELWMKLGRPEITSITQLEECLANSYKEEPSNVLS